MAAVTVMGPAPEAVPEAALFKARLELGLKVGDAVVACWTLIVDCGLLLLVCQVMAGLGCM